MQHSSPPPVSKRAINSEVVGFTPYKTDLVPRLVTCGTDQLCIEWDNGATSFFHYIWLRDNCQCERCVSRLTREQLFEICDVPLSIKPSSAYLNPQRQLVIEWEFELQHSQYLAGWLQAHCYSDAAREKHQFKPQLWDKSSIARQLPRYCAADIMCSETSLLNWLKDLRLVGISLLENVGTTPGTVEKVAQRISFIRQSNFGRVFDVKAKASANSAAYTTLRLPLHTDLPTRELQPGLQFLHCLINDATGGESILVDGFKIAEYIRRHQPAAFKALSQYPLSFYNKAVDSDYRFSAPLIGTDTTGAITEIRMANFLRGPLAIAPDQVIDLYVGYRLFIELTRQQRFQFTHRLSAGELIVFDNRRVLHSRNAFDLKQGARHLQGCYVDNDELNSRIRVSERNL